MTQELDFRLATKRDASGLFPFWTDDSVTRFTLIRHIKTIADCEKKILGHLDSISTKGGLGPFCVRNQNTIIGYGGATAVEGRAGEYEIFYNLGKDHWGRGFGKATAQYLIDQLFADTKTKRVIAFAVADNIASWKILEAVGMHRVETLVDDFENAEGKFDLYRYEKVRE